MIEDSRRARRLLRWYPKSWRDTYGEEFEALLLDEFAEQPHSLARSFDVIRGGTVARLTNSGITGVPRSSERQSQLSFTWIVVSLLIFLTFGNALWSQLIIGWQWARPSGAGTFIAMWMLTISMVAFGVLALAAITPLVGELAKQLWTERSGRLAASTAMVTVGTLVFVVGAIHFSHGWPGTNGHHWSEQGLVPGGIGAFAWAATLSITSYWVHLGALSSFPAAEVVWMTVSPIALATAVVGSARVLRRLQLSEHQIEFQRRLAVGASWAMALFVLGTMVWLVDGSDLQRNLFHKGIIDVADLVVMVASLLVAWRALLRIRLRDQSAAVLVH